MQNKAYDLIVIGAGSGGISAVNIANNFGKKVALVEKEKIGGDCTWYGCVPSKALLKVSQIAFQTKNLKKYGLNAAESKLDTRDVMKHVRAIRAGVYEEEKPEVFEEKGIDVYIGSPAFLDRNQIRVDDIILESSSFVIATGSGPFVPDIEGLGEVDYLTNESLFELETLPESMIVLGGGPIGIEMASALNRLGVKTTVVERAGHILSRDDPVLSDRLATLLENEGLTILRHTSADRVRQKNGQILVTISSKDGSGSELVADRLLIAVGRRPNISNLDLGKAGVEYNNRGIPTDASLRTHVPNIYAIGDVLGSYQFSHVAEYHASIAVPNAILPLPVKRKVNYDNIVWATFTDPELAHAGLTETEARDQFGDSVRVYTHEYKNIDRAKTDLTTAGMSKFVCDSKGKLLGIHILGEHAADLMHEAVLAKAMGHKFAKISSVIHVYPTYTDIIKRPATKSFVDNLQNNVFIKLGKKLFSK